jgi:hypothetical protein
VAVAYISAEKAIGVTSMFEIKTAHSKQNSASELMTELKQQLGDGHFQFGLVMGHYSRVALLEQCDLTELSPQWLGGSSCLGVMTDQGVFLQQDSLAVLMIRDDEGAYGSGSAAIESEDIAAATEKALMLALAQAGRSFQAPELVWCMQPPGTEEAVLLRIEQLLGKRVPVYGGSSADDDISGQWLQYDGKATHRNAIVIAVFYPSVAISHFFHSGYAATQHSGVVTQASGRLLQQIDGKPAVEVYSQWLGRTINDNYMQETTLSPLGSEVVQKHLDLPLYLLSLPIDFLPDGSIQLFAEVQQGQTLCMMSSEIPRLLSRTATMCECAKSVLPRQEVSGGIVIFCGACLLSIRSQIDQVQHSVKDTLGDAPFIIGFTFGEQGYAVDQSNRHGNLMYATVLFGGQDVRY